MLQVSGLFDKLASVRSRIDQAARKAGRPPSQVDLMAVTKYAPAVAVRELLESGRVAHAGESRIQDSGPRFPGIQYHFIGNLQSNKAGKAVELFEWIDSVDSLELAGKLDRSAGMRSKKVKILVQVQPEPNPKQSGLQPQQLEKFLVQARDFQHLQVRGLMAIAPMTENVEGARPHFRRIRKLFEDSFPTSAPGGERPVLSMGMSRDFEVAVEEGATLVRIGSLLFGESSETPVEEETT